MQNRAKGKVECHGVGFLRWTRWVKCWVRYVMCEMGNVGKMGIVKMAVEMDNTVGKMDEMAKQEALVF